MTFKQTLTLALLTMLIIVLAAGYAWYIKKDAVTTTYIPNREWSQQTHKVPGLTVDAMMYDCALDANANFHTVWVEVDRSTGTRHLYHTAVDPQGEVVIPQKRVLSDATVGNLTLAISNSKLHIFWTGETNEGLKLYDTSLDLQGQILNTATVVQNGLQVPNNVQASATPGGQLILAWADIVGRYTQIKHAQITEAGEMIDEPKQVTFKETNCDGLRLTVDTNGSYYLVWSEALGQNSFGLSYQGFSAEGQMIGQQQMIDEGKLSPAALAASNGKLYLVWRKNKTLFEPDQIFGTIISLDRSVPVGEIRQLSKRAGSFRNPSLRVDSNGQVHLITVMIYNYYTSLAYQMYDSELTTELRAADWIYPEVIDTNDTRLFLDSSDKLHLAWAKGGLRYANTAFAMKPTFWQVLGLNSNNYAESFWKSLLYVFCWPVFERMFFVLAYYGIIAIVYITLAFGAVYLIYIHYRPIPTYRNLYLFTLMVIAALTLVGYLVLDEYTGWFAVDLLFQHFWFVAGVPLALILLFIAINKMRKKELLYAAFMASIWVYWMTLILSVMNLQAVNFNIPPVLG